MTKGIQRFTDNTMIVAESGPKNIINRPMRAGKQFRRPYIKLQVMKKKHTIRAVVAELEEKSNKSVNCGSHL